MAAGRYNEVMAQRRMFSLQIVDSDAFLDMPHSSQLLYFHLSMRADDDGFIGNAKKISRMLVSSDDDMKILLMKRFLLPFPSGVIVVKHWKIHNYIQSDRYHETQYLDEKKGLITKENGVYTDRVQDVSNMDTEARLEQGKERKEESGVGSIKYLSSIPEEDMKEFVARFEVSPSKVRSIGEDLVLYCQRKGKVYKNYKAFLLNALKRDCKERPAPKPAPAPEKPLTPEDRERQAKKFKEIGDQIRGLAAAKKI